MPKQLLYSTEARAALKKGVDKVADSVRITIGPKGRNVVLDKKFGSPTITNDGVTIAKEIELEDPFENMGAQLVKEVASKTNDSAGDGTTTATVLAAAIINEGLKNVAAGANPMLLKQGIELATDKVVAAIKGMAKEVQGREEVAQVAAISAADPAIGSLIAEVMEKVGKDGVVTVEESKGIRTETEYVEGMSFDRGYISPYFVTNPERMEAVIDDPYILITDKKISAVNDIVPLLERLLQTSKKLIIIADDVDGEALATLAVGAVAHALIPAMAWGPALVLGAIVSSTDEVAFAPIVERIPMPRHVLATIEGESLVNDATSLVLYAIGVTAIVTGTFSLPHAFGELVVSVIGAIAIGLVVAFLAVLAWHLTKDDPVQAAIALRNPYVDALSVLQISQLVNKRSRRDHSAEELERIESVLATFFEGSPRKLRLNLLDSEQLHPDEERRLRMLLEGDR